jgi:hypothetical protein
MATTSISLAQPRSPITISSVRRDVYTVPAEPLLARIGHPSWLEDALPVHVMEGPVFWQADATLLGIERLIEADVVRNFVSWCDG